MQPDLPQEIRILPADAVKNRHIEVDKIHLVHQHHHLPDPQHGEQIPVATGVFPHAFLGIDDQERRFRARRARHHVFKKFDMTRVRQ